MNRRITMTILLALAALVSIYDVEPSFAQTASLTNSEIRRSSSIPSNWPERISPYRTSWSRDLPILAAVFGANSWGNSLTSERTYLAPERAATMAHRQINWFDRGATFRYSENLKEVSNQLGSLMWIAPLSLMASSEIRKNADKIGVMFLQTFLFQSAAGSFSKHVFPRYRPFVYNDNLDYDQKMASDPGKSFMSSQTAAVWASLVFSAKVFSDYYPESNLKPFVWGGAIVAGSAIGYVRYATGIHYPSDIIAGAIIGGAIGYAVPALHRVTPGNLDIAPVSNMQGASLQVVYTFN